MHLVILPGNSQKYNEEWLYDSEKHLKDLFESVTTHYYKHWENGGDSIDIEYEVEKLAEETKNLDKYVIYAKSAGIVTTVRALNKNKISPEKCIFAGSPFKWAAENDPEFKDNFKGVDVPVLFIQQTDDPFFAYKDLEKFLEKNPLSNYQLIEIVGDNHAYDNYEALKDMISDFINL